MGAMINIVYNEKEVSDSEASSLMQGIQKIVAEIMAVKDVFVYVTKPLLVIADPIEVFIQVNKKEVNDFAQLTEAITLRLSEWKEKNQFKPVININLHPVEWHYKIGI